MIGWKEVPTEHLIGQRKVALENTGHLSVEVLPPTELLQDLHSEHEDLHEIVLLQHTHTLIIKDTSSQVNAGYWY